jgi:hypothetical protein
MDSSKLPLRILYTINSSPQYILARSLSAVPVVLLPQTQNTSAASQSLSPYATTSLKACLDTICRSSPEIVQDVARDFSVYVLDPLESNSAPAPVNISNATLHAGLPATVEPSNGVAVGLGLMSWALVAGESDGVTVTGTLVKQGMGKEALEVIFALREVRIFLIMFVSGHRKSNAFTVLQTAAMQKTNLNSWATLPTSTSNPCEIPPFQSNLSLNSRHQ